MKEMNPTERLLEIQAEIDFANSKLSEIKGQMQSIKEQMRTKFNVANIASATQKLQQMQKELDEREADFKDRMRELDDVFSKHSQDEDT